MIEYELSSPNEKFIEKPHHNPFLRGHKNSKIPDNFYRTKPSVIEQVKTLGASKKPKMILKEIHSGSGGLFSDASPSDIPRNNRQIYNHIRFVQDRPKTRNTGVIKSADYSKLYSLASAGHFVKDVSLGVSLTLFFYLLSYH